MHTIYHNYYEISALEKETNRCFSLIKLQEATTRVWQNLQFVLYISSFTVAFDNQ